MGKISEEFQDIPLEKIKNNPELITGILFKDQDISVVLEKHGDTVRLAHMRSYDNKTTRILTEAKRKHDRKKQEGYTREQAFNDFLEVQEEITNQI